MAAFNNFSTSVGEIFNIGTDVTHTTAECIEIVQDILGTNATLDMKPPRAGDQLETSAKIGKARKLLGYEPKVGLREGVEKQIVWLKQHREILE